MKTVTINLYRTSNLSARIIHFGMWVYAKLRGLPQIKCYNHCEIEGDGETYGAVSPVVRKMNAVEYRSNLRAKGVYEDCKIIELNLTAKEANNGIMFLESMIGTKYEYSMFISHASYILFGWWLGRKRPQRMSCYELMARFLNSTGKYKKIDIAVNPYQFEKKYLPLIIANNF